MVKVNADGHVWCEAVCRIDVPLPVAADSIRRCAARVFERKNDSKNKVEYGRV